MDSYHRRINYLRISITDRCNLSCIYCVPRHRLPKLNHNEILRYEEILRLVRISVRLGISKVRITGGEPLVRKGVYYFLNELSKIKGLEDISLTTNGVLLIKDNLEKIKAAGINRINISIDTLDKKKYKAITGHEDFHRVWSAIELAHEMGFDPIKLNIVALKGLNDDELINIARLSFTYPFQMRFIEYMPIGSSCLTFEQHLPVSEIMKRISSLGKLIPVENNANDGPANRYRFEGAKGEIGFISAISHPFCHKCNRLRLTASGGLRPCLLSDYQEDLKVPLRRGCLDNELVDIFFKAIRHKPIVRKIAKDHSIGVSDQMHTIGG
ncbi:MAG: GTP 3',8-cyclase MoaA [Desulfobacterales bacterium]|nr:GTP 3',8-cyclase MoaA [Desulfobacterales bacterium]